MFKVQPWAAGPADPVSGAMTRPTGISRTEAIGNFREIFDIRETVLTDRIDDAIIGLYGFIGIGVLIYYRIELISCKKASDLPFFIWE